MQWWWSYAGCNTTPFSTWSPRIPKPVWAAPDYAPQCQPRPLPEAPTELSWHAGEDRRRMHLAVKLVRKRTCKSSVGRSDGLQELYSYMYA